jgi:hypothetical protein
MEELTKIAGQYGGLGLTLLASFWYINKKDGEYKIERESYTKLLENLHKDALTAINNNTTILTEISTIIKDR